MQTETTEPPAGQDAGPGSTSGQSDEMGASTWIRLALLVGALVLLGQAAGVWGLVIVLGLVLLIFCHELGHFISAKRSGMKVTEFFIGFGPRIWSFRRGETEYGLKAIPAGAYVRIIGMHNLEDVEPADEGRTYRQKPFRARLATVLAGVGMNFLIAVVLIYVLLAVVGTPGGAIATEADQSAWQVGKVVEDSAAAAADIKVEDKILSIDGQKIEKFTELKEVVTPRGGETVEVVVLRDGKTRTLDVTIGEEKGKGFLGVGSMLPSQRVGPVAAVPKTFHEFGAITVASTQALGNFFSPSGLSNFAGLVARGGDPEPVDEPPKGKIASSSSSSASGSEDARLISLFGIVRLGDEIGAAGWSAILILFISINIFLGVVNLVPLLPFDGGHAVIAVYEKAQELRTRRKARYFADINRLLPLTYAVVVLLAMVFLTTTYLDIVGPMEVSR